MIAWLVGLGLSERVAKIVMPVTIAIGILIAFYLVLDAYGDARFEAGVAETDAAYAAAAKALEASSRSAAAKADKPARAREEAYFERLEQEKEKVDAAVAKGHDPLDELFGAAGM